MWLFQGMAFVCCQRYPILCHGRIPFLGPFHTLRPYESESYVTRQSKIDEALGYDVRTYSGDKVVKARRGRETKVYARVRSVVERIQLHIPEEKVRKFCKDKGYGIWESLHPTHKPEWLQRSDPEIILAYNAEMRGFAHYYSLAHCAKLELHKLYVIWQTSLFKTLAWKHKTSVSKIAKQLRGKQGYEYKFRTPKG